MRTQDKINIKYLAVMVATACAFTAVMLVQNESDRAKRDYQQQRSYVDQQMARLSPEDTNASFNIVEEIPVEMLERAKLDLVSKTLRMEKMATGFWVSAPVWMFAAVCVGTGLSAAIGGFCVSWVFFWAIVLMRIRIMRRFSRIDRKELPYQKIAAESLQTSTHAALLLRPSQPQPDVVPSSPRQPRQQANAARGQPCIR